MNVVARARRSPGAAVCGIAFLLPILSTTARPAPVSAQQGATAVHLFGGLPFPGDDLANVSDGGSTFGLGVERRLTRRLSVLVLGSRSYLDPIGTEGPGQFAGGPPVVFWAYTAGLQLELTEPPGRRGPGDRWEAVLNLGAGGGTYDVKISEADPGSFTAGLANDSVNVATNPVLTGGFRVGPDITDFANLFFQTQLYVIFGDAADPEDFLGKEFLVTNTVGFRFRF